MECENRGKAASATAKALEDLGKLKGTLAFADGATFETCVQEACGRFYKLFRDRVLQLTHNFPEVMTIMIMIMSNNHDHDNEDFRVGGG